MSPSRSIVLSLVFSIVIPALAACGGSQVPSAMPTIAPTHTAQVILPEITAVEIDRNDVPRYESIEITVDLVAEYSNPYDAREVALDGVFTGPDGLEMKAPGFWDGEGAWKIRFTPSQAGAWTYAVSVRDARGASLPVLGEINVTSSDKHGWIVPGNSYNADYSGHYLIYHDGTPFYGLGHAEALKILIDGFDEQEGVRLFDNMKAAGENYVVWWPLYSSSPVSGSYDDYSVPNLKVIDMVVKDAEEEGIHLIFTVWDHPQLRDDQHPTWEAGNWEMNGFSKLGSLSDFFVTDESWAWQENLYRYLVARWGYSPSIGMWLTVSEINGTNALEQTDAWHARVNDYFAANDPYRHPTTASKSGEEDWPEGHAIMDAPQVHLYDFDDVVGAAQHIADWTSRMWDREEKPNWIGEFGVPDNRYYPELFHNSIWSALASGASMTPAEWNGSGAWGRMTPEMSADISRLAEFVKELPLARWNPTKIEISSSDPEVRAWGLAGQEGGLFWVQDFSLDGQPVEEVRASMPERSGVRVGLRGVAPGAYAILPFDTWQGVYLDPIDVECSEGEPCNIPLPDFKSDMAFKILRQ